MKIIRPEEHMADPALRAAAQPGTTRQAPCYGDLNSRFEDDADADAPGALSALRVVKQAVGMTGQPIGERIAAMD